jgi:hypothetical protein
MGDHGERLVVARRENEEANEHHLEHINDPDGDLRV